MRILFALSRLCVRGNSVTYLSKVPTGHSSSRLLDLGYTCELAASKFLILLLFWKQRMLRRFPVLKKISPKMYISICLFIYLIFLKVGVSLGYLLMDELQRAVAPFLHASGGGMSGSEGNLGGSSGGPGWPSFGVGLFADNSSSYSNDEEFAQPNPQNAPPNAVEAVLPEPDMDSVRGVIKQRLLVHRLGQKNFSVSEKEIDQIVELKNDILNRMGELDPDPFWTSHRRRLIRDYILPRVGGEHRIKVLTQKLNFLLGESPTSSLIFKQLMREKDSFFLDAPFRGPR